MTRRPQSNLSPAYKAKLALIAIRAGERRLWPSRPTFTLTGSRNGGRSVRRALRGSAVPRWRGIDVRPELRHA